MKKRILLFLVAMMMCVSSVCLASANSNLLNNEEKTAELAVQVLVGRTAPDELIPLCDPGFAKNSLSTAKLNEDRAKIRELVGTLKNSSFFQLTKLTLINNETKATTPIDRVGYIVTGSKNVNMVCMFDFFVNGKKPMLMGANFNVQQPNQQPAAKK